MKTNNRSIVCLSAVIAALATGCAVSVAPPVVDVAPPVAEVTVGVPDAYVWTASNMLASWAASICTSGLEELGSSAALSGWSAFTGGKRGHPDWRRTAIRNEGRNAHGRAPARRVKRNDDHR